MGNFHSDDWIINRVEEHYNEALTLYPKNRILGIFYQGSGNYGLDTPKSDVDTKCILLPTLEEICFNKSPISYTHVRENNEHIDFKDIREMMKCFKKGNINFLEILFTQYNFINPDYYTLWEPMFVNAEKLARYDNYRFIKATAGMSAEKYHALCLDRPSQHDEIQQYGWATKQLHHLMRLSLFISRWTVGESFANCLIDPRSKLLTALKCNGHDLLTLEEAQAQAKELDERIKNIKDGYLATHEHLVDSESEEIVNSVTINIIKKCLSSQP